MKAILILLVSQVALAGEVWVKAPVMDARGKLHNLKGVFDADKPTRVAECLNQLRTEAPTYAKQCADRFGTLLEEGDVKTSLLGSHIHCTLSCLTPPIPAGKCVVQKYVDSVGLQKSPFYLLQTADFKYTFARLIAMPGTSPEGLVVELIKLAEQTQACES